MIECVVWWAEPITAPEAALALLDPPERDRHAAYRRAEDKQRFLTGRALAKTVAGEALGLPPSSVHFDATCTDCGKQHGPVRVPGAPLALSISHSGDRVGVALTSGTPVGLDVESAARDADDGLIEYALNDTERAGLPAAKAERTRAFFTFWTRKEALMKATGRGLRIPLRALTVSGADEPARLLASDDSALDPGGTRVADLDPGPGYRAAVVLLTSDEIDVTERWWSQVPSAGGQ
ncbi:4'-phosphopantetheinyl transferase [Saccharomonospora piscinae]|uniref:4'-phosphopantetheinyl transferase n=1 Tax=Saccharomonospora piscinae TaxID=687388 RepID=A0A1V9A6A0_SACPI|nr:4'-phosphopantetheinyl transferase superfamily protein [Saccharomonospora piscinae]OQO92659.1 4'-phosphopantetheinyl transferase [Saccharomonospora piscinae]TLW91635.1 4'-phosphopantetheinyl transferase superfamily protein [Saccharomonospora piscinae]